MASFHLIVPPTFDTVCLLLDCGQVGAHGIHSFEAITHALRPAKSGGQGMLWNYPVDANIHRGCSTIELPGQRWSPGLDLNQ